MRILLVTQGEYGKRMLRNLRENGPPTWIIGEWQAPAVLPPVMDYPEDYSPDALAPADLVVSLGENPGVAELIPKIAGLTGAKAVIAPIDRQEWLPKGLARQLGGWLRDMSVEVVFPKPFCSLTKTHYNVLRHRVPYDNELIAEFARHFGGPRFVISVDPDTKMITDVQVERDAVCGCGRYIGEGLVGVAADDAVFQAGMLHHHYPCLAAMGIDDDFADTLMHVSGNIAKEAVKEQVRPFLKVQYFTPHGRADVAEQSAQGELGEPESSWPAARDTGIGR